ncbi:SUMF1/EgtB/PvdO family nonheme iron enzyme [Kitasatospora camelliae]|uniref:SUMF1/EgtB/PvdO family nonheme iron enzyme n=1 Tax=Kitasatospora camelliae TaxID=3156397 RepID=A0AAU8JTW7_9ACTN
MDAGELTLAEWRAWSDEERRALVAGLAGRLGADSWAVETSGGPEGGATARLVLRGRTFALVPGGEARLGVDPAAFTPTPEQAESYAGSCRDFGFPEDLRAHLAEALSQPRTVRIPALLVGVEPEEVEADWEELPEAVAALGWRLPTPDEWEYACGAGGGTLFRWGAEHPPAADPFSAATGPHREPNAFGLRIARDPYQPEATSEPGVLCGGDGGEATCGGYGAFLAWLPLAPAYRDRGLAEMLESGDYPDAPLVRPVIDL